MKQIRTVLSNFIFIHFLVGLGLLSLVGYLQLDNQWIALGMTASFAGAICGSFIRVIDAIKANRV
ncbi:MAG: hypothetical protein WCI62_04255 [Erysipelotrichaceae bacterium]